jgi:hypothetical protein
VGTLWDISWQASCWSGLVQRLGQASRLITYPAKVKEENSASTVAAYFLFSYTTFFYLDSVNLRYKKFGIFYFLRQQGY